jgi:hypothetical protein
MASSGPERQWCSVHHASRTDTQEQLTTTGDEDVVNVSLSKGREKNIITRPIQKTIIIHVYEMDAGLNRQRILIKRRQVRVYIPRTRVGERERERKRDLADEWPTVVSLYVWLV